MLGVSMCLGNATTLAPGRSKRATRGDERKKGRRCERSDRTLRFGAAPFGRSPKPRSGAAPFGLGLWELVWLLVAFGFWQLLAFGGVWLLAASGFWRVLAFGGFWLVVAFGFWRLLGFGGCWL